MIPRAICLVGLLASLTLARGEDLPAGWVWVYNGDRKIVGAMAFGKDDSLGRHVKKTARYLKSDRMFLAFHARDHKIEEALLVANLVKAQFEADKRTIRVAHLSSCESAMEFPVGVSGIDSLSAETETLSFRKGGRVWSSGSVEHLPARAQILSDALGVPVIGEIPKVENEEARFRALYLYEYYAYGVSHPDEFAARQKLFFPHSLRQAAKPPEPIPFKAFIDENYEGFAPPGAAKCTFGKLAG